MKKKFIKKKLRSFLALLTAACITMSVPVYAEGTAGLTRDDFRITTSTIDELNQYGGDTIDALTALYGNQASFYFYSLTPNSVPTCRNITLGVSTKSDIIDELGYAPYYTFDVSTEPICTQKMYSSDNAADLAQVFPTLSTMLVYNYKNLYQMAFYLDGNDVVQLIYVFNYIFYSPGESTIKDAQTLLNTFGYDCGTPDGKIGKNTTNAITAYQNAKGLYASGVVDNELLNSLYTELASKGVETNFFIQRYNEAIDVFNAAPEAGGATSSHISWDDLRTNGFSPTGNVSFTVNPDINYFGHIISCKGWVNDPGNFNSTVAAGELAAMIYAIDPAMPDCNTAMQMIGVIKEQSPAEHNGILFEDISANGAAAINCRYYWS